MSEVSCLVHYGSIKTANTLTKVSEASFQTLLECKSIRVRLGGVCKKTAIKVKGKRQVLTKIVTKSAEITLKQAAKLRNDEEMLIAVQDVDLIAKDFQRHEYCYREYTRLVWDKGQNENIETTGGFR